MTGVLLDEFNKPPGTFGQRRRRRGNGRQRQSDAGHQRKRMEATLHKQRSLTPARTRILETINVYGRLDRAQIQRIVYPGKNLIADKVQTQRNLKVLVDLGLITPVRQLLVQGLGARPNVYTLTIEGQHLFGEKKRSREYERGGFYLEHERAANSVLLSFEAAARSQGWESEILPEAKIRPQLGRGPCIPDGRVILKRPGTTRCYLIEYDRGNEYRDKWLRKIRSYVDAGNSKALTRDHGTSAIQVLTIARGRTSPLDPVLDPSLATARIKELLEWTRTLTQSDRFLFASEVDLLAPGNVLTDPIWISAKNPTPHPLF